MDSSTNTRPLLDNSSDNELECENEEEGAFEKEDEQVVIKDTSNLVEVWIPADRYNISYVIFYFLGTILLLPWFFFVTAEDYWMYKFRPLAKNVTMTSGSGRSELQTSFTSFMTMASTVPTILFFVINPFLSNKISLHIRIIGSLLVTLVFFILTTVLVEVNTDSWQHEFYILTLLIVVILSASSAILQGAVFGIVGLFPRSYISACVSGQVLGGILASVAQITSLAVGASPILSALVYFLMADFFILLAIFAYIFLSSTLFFKYYSNVLSGPGEYSPIPQHHQAISSAQVSFNTILKKIKYYGMAEWFCFAVMFSVYPGITVLVKPTMGNPDSTWNKLYFVPVVTFLLYNFSDYTGRIIAGFIQKPQDGGRLLILSIVRIVIAPLIVLCNAQPRQHVPVLFPNDYVYVVLIIVLGLSNGYIANLSFICASKSVDPHEQEIAGSMLTAFLGIGIACGSVINLFVLELI